MMTPTHTTGPLPPGRLALEDGTVFHGRAFGATGRGISQTAEVVFNTAMSGYQEAITDPSYCGQVLVFTAPLIGNTGVNTEDLESARVQVSGVVVRELTRRHSNFRATGDLSAYLREAGVLGLCEVDTRALTKRLRTRGVMRGVITDVSEADLTDQALGNAARLAPDMSGQNLVPLVGCTNRSTWRETLGEWSPAAVMPGAGGEAARPARSSGFRVVAFDCGAKRNILRNLADRGCEVTVVPHDSSAAEIRGLLGAAGGGTLNGALGHADGLFISNGPGDPAAVERTIETLRELLTGVARPLPVFGICLGHQLLALALGAKTYKLKFGHRGLNQPVLNLLTGRVEITSQNHGFAVDPDSLKTVGGLPTHINLNDGTLAGFCLHDRPVFAVQHHPEASPGPHDSGYLFDAFVEMMETGRPMSAGRSRASLLSTTHKTPVPAGSPRR